jgi:hypothetical protein
MRTTVDLPDELFREAETRAALEGVPLPHFIERSLRLALSGQTSPGRLRLTFPLHRSAHPGALTSDLVRIAEEASANQEDTSLADAV